MVDNDNKLAEENRPLNNEENEHEVQYSEWGMSTPVCKWQIQTCNTWESATMKRHTNRQLHEMLRCNYFLELFPIEYMALYLTHVNMNVPETLQIKFWEFLRWLGIWFLLSTVEGHTKDIFWNKQNIDQRFFGMPFTILISKTRFDFITKTMQYTT